MASAALPLAPNPSAFLTELSQDRRAIGGARFDALCFWGAPPLALVVVLALSFVTALLPVAVGGVVAIMLAACFGIITYAHLIAVVPRAYLNREVFAAHRFRLTVVPVLLVAALASSPVVLVAGAVLAVFWDVHHTAMQNFGIGRIYDMKAGNPPAALRRTDLLLAWALYIGPAAAGASMIVHVRSFARFDGVGWHLIATAPGAIEGWSGAIRIAALVAWIGIVGFALWSYSRARRDGYRPSAQKLALLVSTGSVSIAAWGFAPPFVAFAVVNLFHAVQYFAIVWLKEGQGIARRMPRAGRGALPVFLALCGGFGLLYWLAAATGGAKPGLILVPFIACSLLHFWYDAFIWSVRRKMV